jgi:PAS domain S-box-containing protein
MASDDDMGAPGAAPAGQAFADSRFGSEAVQHLRAAFEHSRRPMLIADDRRRWVTGNAAACALLGISPDEVPWRSIDDFTPPKERRRLAEQWEAFLGSGEAEGWYHLHVPDRGEVPAEFSATANVLPRRHLLVFIPPDETTERAPVAAVPWTPVTTEPRDRPELTDREREVLSLVASGLQTDDMADRLVLSPETVNSHVYNAMGKLGVHTRAHAVAVGLVTGQIAWELGASGDASVSD